MAENEDLTDTPRSRRPAELHDDKLISSLENETSSSSREMAAELGVSQTTVLTHLQLCPQEAKTLSPRGEY
ncbi:hypothetical protein KIN20_013700 [Parelaphostrongylus tenuis]|uniref:Uncharacterized protein n=1 Tax=Parelaphostrongylus tenuis TaxID=148309 RepID=A0AAD5MYI1_PARTN|nr:hypothetical protein KIN20_013700 [Parelaphostrongylus tenuis]